MRATKHLPRIGLTVVTLSAIALGSGCQSTGSSYRTTSLAPVRSDSSASMSAAGSAGAASQTYQGESRVVIPLYEERLRVGTREVDAGGVRIRKEITTETVSQPIQVRRETLVIDRLPVGESSGSGQAQFDANASSGTRFEQREIEIRLMREEPVVEKEIVQTGRIVAEKRTQSEQTHVQREVRRENIDVNQFGNTQNVIISDDLRQRLQRSSVGASGASSQKETGEAGGQTGR